MLEKNYNLTAICSVPHCQNTPLWHEEELKLGEKQKYYCEIHNPEKNQQLKIGSPKQEAKRRKHQFLLTFFPPEPQYEEKEVNGFILVKYFSNSTKEWEVQIYTKDSFVKRQDYLAEAVQAKKDSSKTLPF